MRSERPPCVPVSWAPVTTKNKVARLFRLWGAIALSLFVPEQLEGQGDVLEVAPPSSSTADLLSILPEVRLPLETLAVSQVQSEGMAAFQRGDFEEAREAYLRVLRVEPSNRSALANLGATEYRLGNNEDSERLLRRALQLKTDNPTAWLNLGILYLDQDQPMLALGALAHAVAYAPRDPLARNYLGVAVGRNRWFDAAEREFRQAIELRPDYATAHFNLAVFCLERNPPTLELVRRHYHKAIELGAAPDGLIEEALK